MTPFRSEAFRRAVSSLPCVACGREGDTQPAHCNQGKGMGIKTSDATCSALCTRCHYDMDFGGMPKEERRQHEKEMNLRTLRRLVEEGRLKTK